jgi:hypothetical protein
LPKVVRVVARLTQSEASVAVSELSVLVSGECPGCCHHKVSPQTVAFLKELRDGIVAYEEDERARMAAAHDGCDTAKMAVARPVP